MLKRSIRIAMVTGFVLLLSMPGMAGDKACGMGDDAAAHGKCPLEHAKVVSTEDVEITGKLLCRHCNLKETDSCEKVFVSESDERYALCPAGDVAAAESISEHGEASMVVKGKVMKLEDGSSVLRIASAAKS